MQGQVTPVLKQHQGQSTVDCRTMSTHLLQKSLSFKLVARQIDRRYSHLSDVKITTVMDSQTCHPALSQSSQLGPLEMKPQKKNFYRWILPPSCVAFSSEEGKKIFKEALLAGHMEVYYGLASQFHTQNGPTFCGPSTLVMVLNTLEVDPKRVWKGVWRWYHEQMLDCCVSLQVVEEKGITFDQFGCLAACNSLSVQMVRGDNQLTEDRLRQDIKAVTMAADKVITISYNRNTFGQTGDGHFSPVGGYHPEKDLILILDTARFKYPPHWVKLSTLCDAMRALDPSTGQPRGYMILKKTGNFPAILFHVAPMLNVCGETQPQTSEQQGLNAFLQSWNHWLAEKNYSQSDVAMCQTSIDQFLRALEHLGPEFLLTTQGYLNCTMSTEHTCAVQELLKSLEGHPLFYAAEEQLNTHLSSSSVFSPSSNNVVCDTSHCGSRNCDTCGFHLDIKAKHFVTILLLAWPYTKCGKNNSSALGQSLNRSMVNCHEILQNEVGQLRHQLRHVMGYMNMCNNCQCRV